MTDSVIFTSCNVDYLNKFLKGFVASSVDAGLKNRFVIDVHSTNQSLDLPIIETTKKHFSNFNFVVRSTEYLPNSTWTDIRTYWACRRYLLLPEMIKMYKKVWVTDIDVIFLKQFPIINNQLAYAISDSKISKTAPAEEQERRKIGTIVKADMIYVDERFYDNAVRIQQEILSSDKQWFADQIALYTVFKDITDYQRLPSSTHRRSLLGELIEQPYLISPGGMKWKKRAEFKEELSKYSRMFDTITKECN